MAVPVTARRRGLAADRAYWEGAPVTALKQSIACLTLVARMADALLGCLAGVEGDIGHPGSEPRRRRKAGGHTRLQESR